MTSLAAAVILAGGQGRRLGGYDKPELLVGGRRLLDIALDAVAGCPVVVVGPPRELPPWVIPAREDPPGGGPAAGVAAGIRALPALLPQSTVAVLAADLPGISRDTVARLCAALVTAGGADPPAGPGGLGEPGGAVLVDTKGHRQFLIGVWRYGDLVTATARRDRWSGAAFRELLAPIQVVEISGSDRETADVDSPSDWRHWQGLTAAGINGAVGHSEAWRRQQ